MTSNSTTAPPSAAPERALYDAFISYSHAKDKPVASALQGVMQRLGKPWHKRRALRVFRDDTSLAATPELWPSIEQALSQSRYLIVLASPQFAASKWCGMEVAYWLEHKSLDTLLIGLTEGELTWDDKASDFRWDDATPLPASLKQRFSHEPKWIDLRAHRESPEHRDAKLIDAAADLAAAVHGIPKEDLLSQEVRQQKRALALAWSAAAVLLALTAAAGWQWFEADRAKRAALAAEHVAQQQRAAAVKAEAQAVSERDRAEKNLALARKAAEDLVFKIAQGLRNVQGMRVESIRQILETAQGVMDELVKSAPDDRDLAYNRHVMFSTFAETYLRAGDIQSARAAAENALAIVRKLAAEQPEENDWQEGLGVALERLGIVHLAGGDHFRARDAFAECLALRRQLAASAPTDSKRQSALSTSLGHLGDVRQALNDHPGALAAYEESLAILRRLAAGDPADPKLLRALSVDLTKIGSLRLAMDDREGALSSFEEGLSLDRRLAATDPRNTLWQHDLSISLGKVGDLRRAAGLRHQALSLYEEALAIVRRLVAADPGQARWQASLATVLFKISNLSPPAQARTMLTEALEIVERLDRESRLTLAQRNWPRMFREALAKLSPETAEAN